MKIKVDIFYKILFIVLLTIPIVSKSNELNTLLSVVIISILIIDTNVKLSKPLLSILLSLIVIICIGVLSSFFYSYKIYDFIKDFFLFFKPILYILIGYYFANKINDKNFIFKAIISLATLFAFYHVIVVFVYILDNPINISKIRYVGGKVNYVELFAIVILFLNRNLQISSNSLKYAKFIKTLLLLSFILYFSRTMLVGVVILILAAKGYLKITSKGLNYMVGIILSVSTIYAILYSVDIERGAEGFEGFAYKIKIAPTEIFPSEIDQNNHAELWDNWRGFEVLKAAEQLEETKYNLGIYFGKGLGSLVDLGFVAPLNKEGIQYIPKIHNGFMNVAYKTGLLGVFFYLFFLLSIYLQAYNKVKTKQEVLINNIISGFGIYFIFTSFIIGGIYNQGDVFTLVLGNLLYLQHFYAK